MSIFSSILHLSGFPTPVMSPLLQHPCLLSLLDNSHTTVHCGVSHLKSVKPLYHSFPILLQHLHFLPAKFFTIEWPSQLLPPWPLYVQIPKTPTEGSRQGHQKSLGCQTSHKLGLNSLKLSATFKIVIALSNSKCCQLLTSVTSCSLANPCQI